MLDCFIVGGLVGLVVGESGTLRLKIQITADLMGGVNRLQNFARVVGFLASDHNGFKMSDPLSDRLPTPAGYLNNVSN